MPIRLRGLYPSDLLLLVTRSRVWIIADVITDLRTVLDLRSAWTRAVTTTLRPHMSLKVLNETRMRDA